MHIYFDYENIKPNTMLLGSNVVDNLDMAVGSPEGRRHVHVQQGTFELGKRFYFLLGYVALWKFLKHSDSLKKVVSVIAQSP
jgi:hypothetical protein